MKPLLCNYYITLKCNSKCSFCNIWKNKKNSELKEQSLEEIKANLVDLKKLGVRFIDFTGGEPLLYPKLVEVLKFAKNLGFYTLITTNCILYPTYARKLKGLIDNLQFSFDSTNEKVHNKIRGVNCYKKVIESIKLAKKIKQKVTLLHTVTNENIEEIPELISFSQKNKCILSLNPCFNYFGNAGLSKENARKLISFFGKNYVYVDLALTRLITKGGNNIVSPICKALSSTIVISPDNYLLLPCYHYHFKKLKIKNNLSKLYHSDDVKKIKKLEGKLKNCQGCTINCYMRTSYHHKPLSKYPYLYLISKLHFLKELARC